MLRVIKFDGHCYQFDNATDADRLLNTNDGAVEMTEAEITAAFGDLAAHVGPHNTTCAEDGTVTFDAPDLTAVASAQAVVDLAAIDVATIRPLRSILVAQEAGDQPDPADVTKLTDLESQALALREKL